MNPLKPGDTIGVLGAGQLGRMLGFEAKRCGFRLHTLDPDPQAPAADISDKFVSARFDDAKALKEFCRDIDVLTYETENVDAGVISQLEAHGVPVYPSSKVVQIAQDRSREKEFANSLQISTARFEVVDCASDHEALLRRLGAPIIIKTVRGGYDGKGQWKAKNAAEVRSICQDAAPLKLIAEEHVRFKLELGVIVARSANGDARVYEPVENIHQDHILHLSICPARIPATVAEAAKQLAVKLAAAIDLVGVLCVELFMLEDGALLLNEFAPRPHNCGHLTIECCAASQFAQQLRAICGLTLGSVQMRSAAAMVNILGTGDGDVLHGLDQALQIEGVYAHFYGKHSARAQRKMGHLTVLAESTELCLQRALAAKQFISYKRERQN